jgi:hypothetical protein
MRAARVRASAAPGDLSHRSPLLRALSSFFAAFIASATHRASPGCAPVFHEGEQLGHLCAAAPHRWQPVGNALTDRTQGRVEVGRLTQALVAQAAIDVSAMDHDGKVRLADEISSNSRTCSARDA